MKEINESINKVALLAQQFQQCLEFKKKTLVEAAKKKTNDVSNFFKSLESLKTAYENYLGSMVRPVTEKHRFDEAFHSIETLSNLAIPKELDPFKFALSDKLTFLEAISKTEDENFHSDFIAALLNPHIMGDFSFEFLGQILNKVPKTKARASKGKTLKTIREKRLDSIDETLSNSDVGARRVDLFIRHNDFVLIIENKISTSESENQTYDYFATAVKAYKGKEIIGILLSPDGQVAMDSNFTSLTYKDLLECLNLASTKLKDDFSKLFYQLYFNSLYRQFIESDIKYNETVMNYWRSYRERRA